MQSLDSSKAEVATRFAELLHNMWNKKIIEFSPKRLWVAIGRKNEMFKET